MKLQIRALVLAVLVAVTVGVAAQDAGRPWMMYGFVRSSGTVSCAAAWGDMGTSQRNTAEWWLAGFVSGAGYASRDTRPLAETEMSALKAWVTKYCADHPLDAMVTAGTRLVEELADRAARAK